MSSKTTSGTNSPPLEATGEDSKPMGVTGASGAKPDAVSDAQQRQHYFKGAETSKQSADQVGAGQPDKVKTD